LHPFVEIAGQERKGES